MIRNLFHAFGETPLGVVMRQSTWSFAIVETIHLLGLAVLGGAVLAINLGAARILFRRNDAAVVARAALPPFILSLMVMVVSGALLVASKPVRYYLDDTFRAKMALLALAILFSIAVQRLVARSSDTPLVRITAIIALLLWLGVGLCGRIIGFL